MDYKILYDNTFPMVEVKLNQGESIKAESDAMVAMSSTVTVDGTLDGSILGGIARRLLTDESFFLQRLKAERGRGWALIAHAIPGGIQDVDLDGSYGLVVQKGGFLACSEGVSINTTTQGIMKGLFSGEGFFLLKLEGQGKAFISSYGAIHPINLEAGEEVIIDNGHLVAWPDYMQYEITKASNGWLSSITSGECIVCKFRGPGTVLIQTRNPDAFKDWIQTMMPAVSPAAGVGTNLSNNNTANGDGSLADSIIGGIGGLLRR